MLSHFICVALSFIVQLPPTLPELTFTFCCRLLNEQRKVLANIWPDRSLVTRATIYFSIFPFSARHRHSSTVALNFFSAATCGNI